MMMTMMMMRMMVMVMQDTALVLSRFNSLILARVFGHDDILALTKHATVPGNDDNSLLSLQIFIPSSSTHIFITLSSTVTSYYRTYVGISFPFPSVSESFAVINALSDLHHPLQALADMLTLQVMVVGVEDGK